MDVGPLKMHFIKAGGLYHPYDPITRSTWRQRFRAVHRALGVTFVKQLTEPVENRGGGMSAFEAMESAEALSFYLVLLATLGNKSHCVVAPTEVEFVAWQVMKADKDRFERVCAAMDGVCRSMGFPYPDPCECDESDLRWGVRVRTASHLKHALFGVRHAPKAQWSLAVAVPLRLTSALVDIKSQSRL